MNLMQKLVVGSGVFALTLQLLFPPWMQIRQVGESHVGYHFLTGDISRWESVNTGLMFINSLYTVLILCGLYLLFGHIGIPTKKQDSERAIRPSAIQQKRDRLIKKLVKLRVRTDHASPITKLDMQYYNAMVSLATGAKLAALPEATIVAIVKMWLDLRREGVVKDDLVARIEDYRSCFRSPGNPPSSPSLVAYIKYRVELEFKLERSLSEAYIEEAVEVCKDAMKFGAW